MNRKTKIAGLLALGVLIAGYPALRAQTPEQSWNRGTQSFEKSLAADAAPAAARKEMITDATVAELLKAPKDYIGTTVRVDGQIKLTVGDEYMRLFYLYDDAGKNRILVHPWLPSSSDKQTMRDILDRPITLTARFLKPTWISLPYLEVQEYSPRAASAAAWSALLDRVKQKGEASPVVPGVVMDFTLTRKTRKAGQETDYRLSVIASNQVSVNAEVVETTEGEGGLLTMRQRIYNSDDKENLTDAHEGLITARKDPKTGVKNVMASSSKDFNPKDPQVLRDWRDLVLQWLAWTSDDGQ